MRSQLKGGDCLRTACLLAIASDYYLKRGDRTRKFNAKTIVLGEKKVIFMLLKNHQGGETMKHLGYKSFFCMVVLGCTMFSLAFAGVEAVVPANYELTIADGHCISSNLAVIFKGGPAIKKGDIIFNFDLSGSMSDDLASMQAAATAIMTQIAASGIDAAFGVVSFVDYPHSYNSCGYSTAYGSGSDYAWKVDRTITTDFASVNATISGLAIYNGDDTPQNYSRALYETQFLNWRADARKIVVIMGDAAVHDCDFFAPTSYGGDPGRDEIMGTADDLDFETVVADLADAGIRVVAINGGPSSVDAVKSFKYMAEQTNGRYFETSNSSQIPPAIINLIGEVLNSIAWLDLKVDADGFSAWASWDPNGYHNVSGEVTLNFNLEFCPPAGTPNGDYAFNLNVMGDELLLAQAPVLIHVGCADPPIADFDSDRNVGLPPMSVTFEDLSKNGPTSWDWDVAVGAFGGHGIHLGDANPATEYWIPGTHDVQLDVENCGGADALLRWNCFRSFVEVYGPSGYTLMDVKDASAAYPDEPWQNAIDGDIWGWNGTATLSTASAPWAIFSFKDGRTKKLTHFRLMTNTGVDLKYKSRWVRKFHIDISTDGLQWSTVVNGAHAGNFKSGSDVWDPDGGWWEQYVLSTPMLAKFVKLVVDEPPVKWAQIGEFEVYEEIQFPDPSKCSITATTPHLNDGKDGSLVTLTLKDSKGNPVTGYNQYDLMFACMEDHRPANVFTPFVESSPGVYQTTLTSTADGTRHIVAAAHGAVIGYDKDYGWTTPVTFIDGLFKYDLKLAGSTESYITESWANAIDGIYEGWNGTATVKGNPPYAIFEFTDSKIYAVNKFALQTDNGTDDNKYSDRQARRIRIEVSTTGMAATDFTKVLETNIKYTSLRYYRLPNPVQAKYIKLSILSPDYGWRQVVEFEAHIDITRGMGQPYAEDQMVVEAAPAEFTLSQNYPNPFNPVTTISYQLPEAGQMMLKIYNTLGQEVATLVDGIVEAGSHTATWNAAEAPAGLYICRMQAGSSFRTTRMLLLK
jgi:PKD repeat protein